MPTLAIALLEALRDHGAREIFGIPGDFVLPFFGVIEESKILPSFTLSHEPAVGFAADAAARYHGGIGVAVVTYGAGAFNLMNSVAGLWGAGKGESGPGWSTPPPAQVAVPDPVPIPGGFGWTPPAKYGPATAGEPYPKQK